MYIVNINLDLNLKSLRNIDPQMIEVKIKWLDSKMINLIKAKYLNSIEIRYLTDKMAMIMISIDETKESVDNIKSITKTI